MTVELSLDSHSGAIMLICIFYGLHMVEEFSFGFVPWADRYFGRFDWTQNLIGNFLFLVCVSAACYLYYENPTRYLWAGMSAAMWILANASLHISCTILGREYSPGVVTAVILYIPGGVYFLSRWGRDGLLTWENLSLSFLVGGMILMLIPTFVRAVHFRAQLAKIFHLVR
jgi:hypothetical protein